MARIDTGGVRKAIATGQHRLPRSSTGICNTTLMIVSLLYRTARTLLSVHAVVHQGRAVDTRLRDPRSDPDGRAPWGEMGVILQQVVGLCLESGRKAVQVGIRRSSTFSACGQGAMPPPRAVITPGGGPPRRGRVPRVHSAHAGRSRGCSWTPFLHPGAAVRSSGARPRGAREDGGGFVDHEHQGRSIAFSDRGAEGVSAWVSSWLVCLRALGASDCSRRGRTLASRARRTAHMPAVHTTPAGSCQHQSMPGRCAAR